MHTKHILAAAVAAAASFGAQAVSVGALGTVTVPSTFNFGNSFAATQPSPGTTFDDTVTFTLVAPGAVVGGHVENTFKNFVGITYDFAKISNFQVTLTGVTVTGSSSSQGPFTGTPNFTLITQTKSLAPTPLSAGSYTLHITGTSDAYNTSTYGGTLTFSTPVPEPETYAMLLAGLGALGFLARRRNA